MEQQPFTDLIVDGHAYLTLTGSVERDGEEWTLTAVIRGPWRGSSATYQVRAHTMDGDVLDAPGRLVSATPGAARDTVVVFASVAAETGVD